MLSNLLCGSRVESKLSSFSPCVARNLADRPSPRLLISDISINTFRSTSLALHLNTDGLVALAALISIVYAFFMC